VDRKAHGEPKHETTQARGSGDHFQGPVGRRVSSARTGPFQWKESKCIKKKNEKMLTISGHKGNANQNYFKIQNSSYHKQQQMLAKMGGVEQERCLHTLLVGR
jgi:hypothetical protein